MFSGAVLRRETAERVSGLVGMLVGSVELA
jgi:hypothetical protein